MAERITITVEAAKLRGLIYEEKFTGKDGIERSVQKVKFEIIAVKEPKEIYNAEKFKLMKTHFASVIQTKEEREDKADTVFIGEGVSMVWKNEDKQASAPVDNNQVDDDPLPF